MTPSARPNHPYVLMLTTQLGYGGAERSFIRLANALSETMQVNVVLFSADSKDGAYSQQHDLLRPKVSLLDDASTPRNQMVRWLYRWGRLRDMKAQADICLSFLSGPNMLNVAAGYFDRSMVSVRGSRLYDPIMAKWNRRVFQYVIDPLVYNLCRSIVPVSPGLAHEICAYAGPWVRPKIHTITPFVDDDAVLASQQTYLAEGYESLKGQPVIVASARLSAEKGFRNLIPVVAKVATRVSGVKLLLIGDGPLLGQLMDLCRQHQLAINNHEPGVASVIFAGYQQDIFSFLRLGRVFAMTSLTEGFSNAALEAMLSGLTVVASNSPWGNRHLLSSAPDSNPNPYPSQQPEHAEFGVLMPRIDRTSHHDYWAKTLSEALLDEGGWRSAYERTARERAMTFSLEKVVPQWRALIERVTRQRA